MLVYMNQAGEINMRNSMENNTDFEKGFHYRIVATNKPLNERHIFYDKAAISFYKASKSL